MNDSSTLTQPSHDDIAGKAKELWENYGRPAGRDEEIWFEAERLLQAPGNAPGGRQPLVDEPLQSRATTSNTTPASNSLPPARPGGSSRGSRAQRK